MAEKKNFTIENFNGTDYDTLYPETNSGQVLLDSSGQNILHLSSGSTVNDGFNSITYGGGGFTIGDVIVTARNNMGDNWLLCNGAIVDGNQYPILKNLLKPAPSVSTGKAIGTANAIYKPGASGEIIYRTDPTVGIQSHNFNTGVDSIEASSVQNSLAFAYVPTKNSYARATYEMQSSSGLNTKVYSGSSLSSMSTSTTINSGSVVGIYPIDDKIFYLVYVFGSSDHKEVTLVSDVTDSFPSESSRRLGIDLAPRDWYALNNLVKVGNNKYLEFVGRKGQFNEYNSIVQFFTHTSGSEFTYIFEKEGNWDMTESDGTVAIFGSKKHSTYYLVKEDSTSNNIASISLPSSNVFGNSYGFFYVGTDNKLYQSVDHASTWNVLMNNVNVGDVCSIVENPQDGKVYIIGTTSTIILTFNTSNILLPTYSPATGLYAYIRAKY